MSKIITTQHPTCPVCMSSGIPLYTDLADRLFDIPGTWSLVSCKDTSCKTLWLNPAPSEESIPLLYLSYPTHTTKTTIGDYIKKPTTLLDSIRGSYLERKYGYPTKNNSLFAVLIGFLAYLHPAWRDDQAANLFYIPAKSNGKLLDVGCGGGGAMEMMGNKGWKVTGIDFDQKAVANAKKKGLDVYCGDLFSQHFPESSFDAILLSHVIEHVPKPLELLKECYRILKKEGVLAILTPNANSRGHKRYGRNWRGLETPHHLQIFTPNSLAKLGEQAGFKENKSFSSMQGVFYILSQSKELEVSQKIDPYNPVLVKNTLYQKTKKHIYWFIFGLQHIVQPGRSEVAVLIAKK